MIAIGERPLDLSDIRAALAGPITVELSAGARARILRSAETVKRLLATGDAIYGVNTGFGKLAQKQIAADQLEAKIVSATAEARRLNSDGGRATSTPRPTWC